jgi:hypothetical protein
MSKLKQTIITRAQAKEQGLKRYFTGKPCIKGGHISERHTPKGNCIACMSDKYQSSKSDSAFKEKRKIQNTKDRKSNTRKTWEEKNKETLYFYKLFYIHANKDLIVEKQKQYREKNRDAIVIKKKEWVSKNMWRFVPHTAKRRAAKLNRMPCWLTKEDKLEIKKIYKLASDKTKETGIKWQVDHIIPLQGETVSGLHIPSNLRIITAYENRSKHNKWEITNEI